MKTRLKLPLVATQFHSRTGTVFADSDGAFTVETGSALETDLRAAGAEDVVILNPSDTVLSRHMLEHSRLSGTSFSLEGKVCAAFGNSIAKQNVVGYSVASQFPYFSHLHWANAFLGAPFRWSPYGGRGGVGTDPTGTGNGQLNNGVFGWSGATTTQLDSYFNNFCDGAAADFIFIHALENDLLAGVGSAAIAFANVKRWIDYAIGSGKTPVVIGCLPSTSFNTTAIGVEYWMLEKMFLDLAKVNRLFCYVSVSDLYTDTSTAGAQPLNSGNFANYTDGVIHPRRAGILIGDRIASRIEARGYVGWPILPGGSAIGSAATNLIGRNTALLGTTGTASAPATGQVAIAMTINGPAMTSVTCSKVVRNGREWQKIVASYAGAAGQPSNNAFGQNETTNWTIGEYVQAFADIEFDNSATFNNWQGTQVQLQQTGGTGDGYGFAMGTTDPALALWPAGRKARIYSPEMVVSSGTASLRGLLLNRSGQNITAADWTWYWGYNGIVNLSR